MNRSDWKTYVFGGLYIIIMIVLAYTSPKPVDWTPSFTKEDKIAYGCYVLFDRLVDIFPEKEIQSVDARCYNVLVDSVYAETNYIFINQQFAADKFDMDYLLEFVEMGNNVFLGIEPSDIYYRLLDPLQLSYEMQMTNPSPFDKGRSLFCTLSDTYYPADSGYTIKSPLYISYFDTSKVDTTTQIEILGYHDYEINFLSIAHGKGRFFLHAFPYAFTNYNLLDSTNHTYAEKCLSAMPVQDIIWDNYYKIGRVGPSKSRMRVVMARRPLRIAWILTLVGLGLYFVFASRRKQRPIEVIKPPENTSLQFIETIGNLYFNKRNHTAVARKRINYFRDYVHRKYHIQLMDFDQTELQTLSLKTGYSFEKIEALFALIKQHLSIGKSSSNQLVLLSKTLNEFYNKN